jgi:hopanoid biosynthesis associated RND transporter like protein HpnN
LANGVSGLRRVEERIGGLAAAWVSAVARRPGAVIAACAAATLLALVFALPRLGLDSSEDALFSPDVHYAELRRDFSRAFPMLMDPLILLIEGPDPDAAARASAALRARLEADPKHFLSVLDPTARAFFESRGLLYLPIDEVEDTIDRLVEAQPLLAEYAADPTLRGFGGVVSRAIEAGEEGPGEGLERWLEALAESVESLGTETPRALDTAGLLGPQERDDSRYYLLVQPVVDHAQLKPAGETLEALEAVLQELGLRGGGPTEVRVTGLYPLSYEEAHLVERQAGAAGLASFFLVSTILFVAIRTRRVVFYLLATLIAGLAWTAAFAAAAIGHLNLISVAFAVLFIGLSVDFGIHLVLRFNEVRELGGAEDALAETARSVGTSLVICAVTTALAFLSFVPTPFTGVAELGLIAGAGMLVSLFLNLTLLPALMVRFGAPLRTAAPPQVDAPSTPRIPWPAIAIGVAALVALPLLPRVSFDTNPLRVRDPAAESVRAFETLLAEGNAFPWNLNVLVGDAAEAEKVVAELARQPTVEKTVWLEDLVPTDQEGKLALLADASLIMGPALSAESSRSPPNDAETRDALVRLRDRALADDRGASRRLGRALSARLQNGEGAYDGLRDAWVAPMNRDLARMHQALLPLAVDSNALPADLRVQRVAVDGRLRVEVFPSDDLGESAALARFVEAVQRVDPNTFGEGVVVHESGQIVIASFRRALLVAALGVLLLLLLLWRNLVDTALVAVPIALAAVLCAAGTVLLGIPINWANVIVIPLLVGIGVDSGIHLVHRFRYEALEGSLLRTSTAQAVVASALTTLASFGTLAFTPHRGMASLGRLLALGIAMILLCNLLVLPALARWWRGADSPAG